MRRRVFRWRRLLARRDKSQLGVLVSPPLNLPFCFGDQLQQLLTVAQVLVFVLVALLLEVFGRQQAVGRGLCSLELARSLCLHLRNLRKLVRGLPCCTTKTSSKHEGLCSGAPAWLWSLNADHGPPGIWLAWWLPKGMHPWETLRLRCAPLPCPGSWNRALSCTKLHRTPAPHKNTKPHGRNQVLLLKFYAFFR